MRWFNNLSIKRKLFLLIFGITLIAQAIAFSILTIERFNSLKQELLNQSHIQARLIGEYCVSPLVFEDMDGLDHILQKIDALPFILSATVYDQNGNLVSYHQKKGETEPIPQHEQHDDVFLKNMLHMREAIIYQGIEYGQIHLRVSTKEFKKEISNQIWLFAWVISGMLIFIYFLANRFQKIISEPILNLANFSDKISKTADYSLQIQKQNEDEIGSLYDGFNNMLNQINIRQEERKQAEKTLRETNARHSAMIENIGDVIAIVGADSLTKYQSPNIEKWFGWKPEDIIGTSGWDKMHPEDIERIQKEFSKVLQKETTSIVEYRFKCKDGKYKWIELTALNCINDPAINGVLLNYHDSTERKQAEFELKKYRDHLEELVKGRTQELESSNKELEAFSYSVSHDLRAPLRAINGFTQILMEDYVEKLDDEGKRLGSVILNNSRKMGQLIDDLLSFSRLGRAAMHFTEIDMKTLVYNVYLEITSPKEQKKIHFSIADLPEVQGDYNMLRQVWVNLISNATKFSAKQNKPIISVTCQEKDKVFIYCIRDNGAGYDMKYQDKLFGVFQRLHLETEFTGTGVGLALVRRIIQRHNGTTWAEGEVGKGAAFYFSLSKNCEK
ncbi:MAG: PAS domain S-box protein [Candidatus Tenebribacter davisii]|nr:PAS domain S-box protein [Candidatus Tenebribacter davisii]